MSSESDSEASGSGSESASSPDSMWSSSGGEGGENCEIVAAKLWNVLPVN